MAVLMLPASNQRLRKFATKKQFEFNIIKNADETFSSEDVREGLVCVYQYQSTRTTV